MGSRIGRRHTLSAEQAVFKELRDALRFAQVQAQLVPPVCTQAASLRPLCLCGTRNLHRCHTPAQHPGNLHDPYFSPRMHPGQLTLGFHHMLVLSMSTSLSAPKYAMLESWHADYNSQDTAPWHVDLGVRLHCAQLSGLIKLQKQSQVRESWYAPGGVVADGWRGSTDEALQTSAHRVGGVQSATQAVGRGRPAHDVWRHRPAERSRAPRRPPRRRPVPWHEWVWRTPSVVAIPIHPFHGMAPAKTICEAHCKALLSYAVRQIKPPVQQ